MLLRQTYWDWSWDELASNDLSAVVPYVYAQSGQQRLHYVGHSLGTLIAFAALSQRQQLGMLRSAGLLSPIAYLNKVASPLALAGADTFLAEVKQTNKRHAMYPDVTTAQNRHTNWSVSSFVSFRLCTGWGSMSSTRQGNFHFSFILFYFTNLLFSVLRLIPPDDKQKIQSELLIQIPPYVTYM